MLRIDIKTFNNFLLQEFVQQLKKNIKFKNLVCIIPLPTKSKSFVVKKSPHVFGRSKEKYNLKVYSGVISFKDIRKKDLLVLCSLLESSKYKEGLGFKFNFK